MKRAKKGFTLIEVICVLVIMTIIAVIAVPNISGYIKKSKQRSCESVMTNFVNDLEYKIVSKRFYDVNDLNNGLISVVNSYSEKEISGISNNTEFEAEGICPNGGKYRVKWNITANANDDTTKVKSASVQVGITPTIDDVEYDHVIECDCMDAYSEKRSYKAAHSFTAALVDAEFSDISSPNGISATINNIQNQLPSPSLSGIVSSVSDANYTIAGLTVNNDKVEWISYYMTDYREQPVVEFHTISFETYTDMVSNKEITIETENVYSVNASDMDDYSKWPPAQGSAGSTVYKEGWKQDNLVAGFGSMIPANASEDDSVSEVEKLRWIQKSGNWYVQSTDDVKGIDFTLPARQPNQDNEAYIADINKLPLMSGKELHNQKLNIYSLNYSDFKTETLEYDLKNNLKVSVNYNNGSMAEFEHIKVSGNPESNDFNIDADYTIKNGFVFLEANIDESGNPVPVDDTWSGIFDNEENRSAEKSKLQSVLADEDRILKVFCDKIRSGQEAYITVAYQEYVKTYDTVTDSYKKEAVTCYDIVKMGTVTSDYSDVKLNSDGTVSIKSQITLKDSAGRDLAEVSGAVNDTFLSDKTGDSVINLKKDDGTVLTRTEGIEYLDQAPGNRVSLVITDPDSDEKVISYIFSIVDGSRFKVEYTPVNGGSFNPENVRVWKETEFILKDQYGGEHGKYYEKTEIFHLSDSNTSDGFYFAEGNENIQYDKEKEDSFISRLSSNRTGGHIYYHTLNTYNNGNIIHVAYIGTTSVSGGKLIYNGEDTYFDPDNLEYMYYYDLTVGSEIYKNEILNVINHWSEDNPDGIGVDSVSKEKDLVALVNSSTQNEEQIIINYPSRDFINFSAGKLTSNFVSLSAVYSGSSSFDFEDLTVYANYEIYVKDENTVNTLHYSKPLAHGADKDNYFVYILGQYEDASWAVNYDKSRQNESDTLSKLSDGYEGTLYITYKDGSDKYTSVNVNTVSGIAVSDYVYFPVQGAEHSVNLVGYIGNNVDVLTIPSVIEGGYWVKEKPSGVEYASYKMPNKEVYYYIKSEDTFKVSAVMTLDTLSTPNGPNELKPIMLKSGYSPDKIVIKNGVTVIGKNSFFGLTSVNSIEIPESVQIIGSNAFKNCGSGGIEGSTFVIPSNVRTIEDSAFANINFSNVNLVIEGASNQIEIYTDLNTKITANNIKSGIFTGSEFSSITFGENIGSIGDSAFENNKSSASLNLGKVKVIGNNAFNGCTKFRNGLVIPESVVSIGGYAFKNYASEAEDADTGILELNAGSTSYGKTIGSKIFDYSKFNGIKIGGKISTIGGYAFHNESETDGKPKTFEEISGTVSIGSNVEKIEQYAFKNCDKITVLEFVPQKSKLTSIGCNAFDGCQNMVPSEEKTFTIPAGVTTIGNNAFKNCTSINRQLVLNDNLKEIGDSAFENCLNLNEGLVITGNVKVVGDRAFWGCSRLTSLEITANAANTGASIGREAFRGCTNVSSGVTVPANFTGDGTTKHRGIGDFAFTEFAASVSSPGPLVLNVGSYGNGTRLGANIFNGAKFRNVIIGGKVDTIDSSAFQNGVLNHDDKEIVIDYSGFSGSLTINGNVKYIGDYAFDNRSFTSFSYTSGTSDEITIGNGAFRNCTQMTGSLAFPSMIYTIGDSAFENCEKLNGTLDLHNAVSIGASAFENCKNITGNVLIPKSVHEIGTHAFKNFASGLDYNTERNKIGSLTVEGYSGTAQFNVYTDNSDDKVSAERTTIEAGIFTGAQFNGLTFGGNLQAIPDGFMNNFEYNQVSSQYNSNADGNSDYRKIHGGLSFGSGIEIIGETAFGGCENLDGIIQFQTSTENRSEKGISIIGANAFNDCIRMYGDVTVPVTVKEIGEGAFKHFAQNRRDDVDSDGRSVIGRLTILGGSSEKGTQIDPFIFSHAHFNGLTIGGNVKRVADGAFYDYTGSKGGSAEYPLANDNGNGLDFNFENSTTENIKGSLILQNSIEYIGKSAFEYGAFDGRLCIGEDVPAQENDSQTVSVGDNAFKDCRNVYGDLIIPSKTVSIGSHAFENFASDVKKNGKNPGALVMFAGTKIADSKNKNADTVEKDVFNGACFKNVRLDGCVHYVGEKAFYSESGITGSLSLASGVWTIGDSAFEKSGFNETLTFESKTDSNNILHGITEIGKLSFSECTGFTGDLVFPDTLTSIGDNAFYQCTGFDGSIKLSENLNTIGDRAFVRCLKIRNGLKIPASVSYIGASAFKGFARETLNPGRLEIYGNSGVDDDGNPILKNPSYSTAIFTDCKFIDVTIGQNVTKIDADLFNNWLHINEIDDPADSKKRVFEFNDKSDNNSRFIDITGNLEIQDTVTSIGMHAFAGCPFDSVTIGKGVTEIGRNAFMYSGTGNGSLKIQGGSMDTVIGLAKNDSGSYTESVFACSRYNGLEIGGNVTSVGADFMKHDMNKISVFNTEYGDKKYSFGISWDYTGITGKLTLDDGIASVGQRAFQNCYNIHGSLEIPATVTAIGDDAFYNCNGLSEGIVLNEGLGSIGARAFQNCTWAFNDWKAPENNPDAEPELKIPASMREIGENAFRDFCSNVGKNSEKCPALVVLSGSSAEGTVLDGHIFTGSHFRNVTLGGNDETAQLTTIASHAFYNANNLEIKESGYSKNDNNYLGLSGNLKLENSITNVGERAFGCCYGFTSLEFGNKIDSIEADAFNRLRNVYGDLLIPDTVHKMGRCSFKLFGAGTYSYVENTDVDGDGNADIFENTNPGSLTIYGNSDYIENEDGTKKYYLGKPDDTIDPIFTGTIFRNVTIGGDVHYIADNFMSNVFHTPNTYENTLDKTNTYDYTHISGDLKFEKTVIEIGDAAFVGCSGFDGKLIFEYDESSNKGVQTIKNDAFNACVNFSGGLTVPKSVTSIGASAFKHFGQESAGTWPLIINGYSSAPNGVKTIDAGIFNHGHYTDVTIAGNVEAIADRFMDNTIEEKFPDKKPVTTYNNIKGTLKIGGNVSSIGKRAFDSVRVDNVVIESGKRQIGQLAFRNSGSANGSITINCWTNGSETSKELGSGSPDLGWFTGAKYNGVTIGNDIKKINSNFMNKYADSITYKDGDSTYTVSHDYSKIKGDLNIGTGVTEIGGWTFTGSGFTGKLDLGNVQKIGGSAFKDCTSFSGDLKIPRSVISIGDSAFVNFGNGSGSLILEGGASGNTTPSGAAFSGAKFNGMTIGGKITQISNNFMNNWENESETHRSKDYWKYSNITGDLTLNSGITQIGTDAFNNCTFDGKLTLPSSGLTTIGARAFDGCTNFYSNTEDKSLLIPESVTSIGTSAFGYFSAEVEGMPASLTVYGYTGSEYHVALYRNKISGNVFTNSKFHNVTFDRKVEMIGENEFADFNGWTGRLVLKTNASKGIYSDAILCDGAFKNNSFSEIYVDTRKFVYYGIKNTQEKVFGPSSASKMISSLN